MELTSLLWIWDCWIEQKTGKPDMRCKENQLAQMNASENKEA